MDPKIQRELRVLRGYVALSAVSFATIFLGASLGNSGARRPGIIFYDDEEDETGALIFGSHVDGNGDYRAGGQSSFDQYRSRRPRTRLHGGYGGILPRDVPGLWGFLISPSNLPFHGPVT